MNKLYVTGVIEIIVHFDMEEPTLGSTHKYADLKKGFKVPEDSVPYGSEGSLSVYKNEEILNKDFNKVVIFTIRGPLRDVDDNGAIKDWLKEIIEKYDPETVLVETSNGEAIELLTLCSLTE